MEWLQSCPTLCDPMDCSPPGSSVHRILQARMLEGAAISFRGSSQPRDWTLSLMSLVLAGRFFTTSTTWKSLNLGLKGLDWDPTNSKQSPFQMLLLGYPREAEQKENYCLREKIQLFGRWDWFEESEILRYKTSLLKEWQETKWKDNSQNGRKYLQMKHQHGINWQNIQRACAAQYHKNKQINQEMGRRTKIDISSKKTNG